MTILEKFQKQADAFSSRMEKNFANRVKKITKKYQCSFLSGNGASNMTMTVKMTDGSEELIDLSDLILTSRGGQSSLSYRYSTEKEVREELSLGYEEPLCTLIKEEDRKRVIAATMEYIQVCSDSDEVTDVWRNIVTDPITWCGRFENGEKQ
jgi:archaellin